MSVPADHTPSQQAQELIARGAKLLYVNDAGDEWVADPAFGGYRVQSVQRPAWQLGMEVALDRNEMGEGAYRIHLSRCDDMTLDYQDTRDKLHVTRAFIDLALSLQDSLSTART